MYIKGDMNKGVVEIIGIDFEAVQQKSQAS